MPIPLKLPPKIIYFAGWEIGNLQAKVPYLLPEGHQWIVSQTGLVVPFPTSQHAPWENSRPATPAGIDPSPNLPTKALLKSALAVYTSSPMHQIFPIIDPPLFSRTVEAAYSHASSPQTGCHSARACVLTFMVLVSSLNHLDPNYHDAKLPAIPREAYIAHASALLPAIIQGPLNLDAVQATMALVVHPFSSPRRQGFSYT